MFAHNIYSVSVIFVIALQLCFCFTIFNTRDITEEISKRKEIPLSLAFNHKATEERIKTLEYTANSKNYNDNFLDFGLVPIDLNYFSNEALAYDIEAGVEQELIQIDRELGVNTMETDAEKAKIKDIMKVSLMHQGMYNPAPEYNSLIDGLIFNVQKDFKKRSMDPLYFNIHDRGVIRHIAKKPEVTTTVSSVTDNGLKAALGGGDIKGFLNLKRFGNAESRRDGGTTLVRSHYFFGPLEIDLVFQSNRGLRTVNSTLSSLAAHVLLEINNINNATTLKEFITDSPMEYEIQLQGTRNKRFQNLGRTAIMRLFKRDSRLETRILRSFRRAASKPIRDSTKRRQQQRRKKEKLNLSVASRPKDQDPKV